MHVQLAKSAVVVGAGILGIATALWLQRDGWNVTLADPSPAAEGGASAGNAGLIAVHIARPIGMPGLWRKLPAMISDPLGPLAIRLAYLPRVAPWLLRLLIASRPATVEAVAQALQSQLSQAWAGYQPLVEESGTGSLIRRSGVIAAYRSPDAIDGSQYELQLLERAGVAFERILGSELQDRVPGISPDYKAGLLFPASGHTVDPQGFAKGLFAHFLATGGQFRQIRIERFRPASRAVDAAVSADGDLEAEIYVCAAGVWSRELCRQLGFRVPLEAERGYHVTLPQSGMDFTTPVILGDAKFAVTPMLSGLRLAGTVELGGIRAPAHQGRYEALLANARIAFPGIDTTGGSRWMGFRPSLPDSLPVIGRSPRHDNLYFAFGHGHLGLTSAGVTGKAVADIAAGRKADFDLAPFRIDRFGWT